MTISVKTYVLTAAGPFPNNRRLPLLLYPQAVALTGNDPAAIFEILFRAHAWGRSWRNGVFDFHDYHGTAHEVSGVYRGVAHQRRSSSPDFAVVGAYPRGQTPDMCYGRPGERPDTDGNIQATAPPAADPVHGASGGLMALWPV